MIKQQIAVKNEAPDPPESPNQFFANKCLVHGILGPTNLHLPKSSVILSRFNLNLELFDLLMEETKNPHFYDSGLDQHIYTQRFPERFPKGIPESTSTIDD